MNNKQQFVVIVHRDRYYFPRLRITVEARVKTATAGEKFIVKRLMESFNKKNFRGPYPRINCKDYRVVDEVGLRRLLAAAKASVTVRRKRAAKKAAVTRARNKARMSVTQPRTEVG